MKLSAVLLTVSVAMTLLGGWLISTLAFGIVLIVDAFFVGGYALMRETEKEPAKPPTPLTAVERARQISERGETG